MDDRKERDGFRRGGNWYKGNLHSHTAQSDGHLPPAEAAAAFRERGYSFLCITDHNLYTDLGEELNREDFIILPGLEAAAVLEDETGACIKTHHINGILGTQEMQDKAGKRRFHHGEKFGPFVYEGHWDGVRAGQDMIDRLHDKGCIVTYNHPIWSRVEPYELLDLRGIDMLEIYNHGTQVESGTGYDTAYWDAALRNGVRLNADAADDNHNWAGFEDAFGGFVMVKADRLTHDAVIEALLRGSYYSSAGPLIEDWGVRDGRAYIQCDPVKRIDVVAGGFVCAGRTFHAKEGGELCCCEMPLMGKETYVRIEITDWKGRKAWTNPIYL